MSTIVTNNEVSVTWAFKYEDLKRRFMFLQEETIKLAKDYETTCDEILYEQDCQTVMVDQYADIRLRRLIMHFQVPKDGMELFMEDKRPEMRKQHPMVSRRELRSLLFKEWDRMTDSEQAIWNTRYQMVMNQSTNDGKKVINTKGSSLKKGTPPISAKIARVGGGGTSKKRSPTGTNTKKRKSEGIVGRSPSPSPTAKKAKKVTIKSESSASPAKSPAPKSNVQSASHSQTNTSGSGKPPTQPRKPAASKAKSKAKPPVSAIPRAKKSSGIASSPSPVKPRTTNATESTKKRAKMTAEKGDDEMEDDDVVDDDESASSVGGSGTDDEDDDEHMSQLPTGAFG